jgi:plastocyanin
MAAMRLRMHPGQMLKVMNQDVDMHRMIEVSGPATMGLGGPMAQGKTDTITFTQFGTYVFGTKVSSMKGMPEVETTGPDNNLKLTVTVA